MEHFNPESLNPTFNFDDIKDDVENCIRQGKGETIEHKGIFAQLLKQIQEVDFRTLANLKEDEKLSIRHLLVICIEQILTHAKQNNWGICKNHEFIYLYNGAYWKVIDEDQLQTFLGEAAEKMGIDKYSARFYSFRKALYQQFLAVANLPKPEGDKSVVLVNLENGTFAISTNKQELRPQQPDDFLTYQLPFEYNPHAKAPLFENYLNRVQPDIGRQKILAEYIGGLFIKSSVLKIEKSLFLYGGGANGKSVFFEITNALLGGQENVSFHSLESLTDKTGYYRAMLANKLLNYASEINGKLETSIFKQLVSGEGVEARLPYGKPFTVTDYAKLIFNCNELPKDVEQTHAFFRRFLIIPFDVTIPEQEQDKELPNKIINNELSGVFNWILEGLNRLLSQKGFTFSDAVEKQNEEYRKQSDSVQLFLEEENYKSDINETTALKTLYVEYQSYCKSYGYHYCSLKTFSERLRNLEYKMKRANEGQRVFIRKENFF